MKREVHIHGSKNKKEFKMCSAWRTGPRSLYNVLKLVGYYKERISYVILFGAGVTKY